MSFDGPLSQISSFYPALSKSVEKNCDLRNKLVEFFYTYDWTESWCKLIITSLKCFTLQIQRSQYVQRK